MRVFVPLLLIGLLAATEPPQAQAPATDAATVLAAAREALGGEKRLAAVKSFVATGRTRQVRGDNLVPIEFEIAAELPDRYVRKDEIPAQESGPTATGFNGEDLIQFPEPPTPPARAGMPAPPAGQMDAIRKARVLTVKQDFARLTMGMFAGSFSSYPLTFTYVGQAEAPQGKADVVDVKGAPNFAMRLFINSQTHLPIMVSWQAATPPMRPGARPGGPPPGGPPAVSSPAGAQPASPAGAPAAGARPGLPSSAAAPSGAPLAAGAPAAASGPATAAPGAPPSAGAPAAPGAAAMGGPGAAPPAPPKPVEYRIYYADYREVDGLQWPFRLRKATGTDTTEETTFDRFKTNTKIDPKKFEVRK